MSPNSPLLKRSQKQQKQQQQQLHHRHPYAQSPSSVLSLVSPLGPSPSLNHKLPQHVQLRDGGVLVKPWGTTKIECFGDYRQEAWLESHIGGPLYASQTALPKLPLPSIEDTLARFLPTALPLVNSQAERTALLDAVEKFPSQAKALQERLCKRQKEYRDSSWLQHWWNTTTYLQVRDPVVINSSYYFHFTDDTTVYTQSQSPAGAGANGAPIQIRRAAAILFATAQLRRQIITGQLPPDTVGRGANTKTLCSTSYKYVFHASRVPGKAQDSYFIFDPALHHHAAVAVLGHIFQIPLVDPHTHDPVSISVLESSLELCVAKAMAAPSATGLAWLTSQERDTWARAYNILSAIPHSRHSLRLLESAACLICLDDTSAYTLQDMAHHLLHGIPMGKSETVLNRWFDKSLQFIVTHNGKAGLLCEHSMMDGMPVARLAELISSHSYKDCIASKSSTIIHPSATFIFDAHSVPPGLQVQIETARREHLAVVAKHEIQTKRFGVYGSDWIKKHVGMSPDAFVQMAMQIATYRLWDGEQDGTYEATQVRSFRDGRTETTRTVSMDSSALVQLFGVHPLWHEVQDATCRARKLAALRNAASAHTKFIRSAAQGAGVDRHFLGLKLALEQNERVPDLFSNPTFAKAKTWRVSTSNLSLPHFDNWGYGQVTPDGVGLSYSILPHRLNFSVTALCQHHWADRLCHHLSETLLELQMLVETDQLAADNCPMETTMTSPRQ